MDWRFWKEKEAKNKELPKEEAASGNRRWPVKKVKISAEGKI